MLKQIFDRIKRTLIVLMLILFLASLTTTSASAHSSKHMVVTVTTTDLKNISSFERNDPTIIIGSLDNIIVIDNGHAII